MARHIFRYSTGFNVRANFMFNIFLCILFLIINKIDFTSYSDDNTAYNTDESIKNSFR